MAEHEKFSEDAIYLTVRTYDDGMSVIMDAATDSLYVKKTLSDYNAAAYDYLKTHEDIQIPEVYSVKEEDGKLTVIEEFIHGKKLDELLQSENKLTFLDRKRILFAVCEGLNFLHRADPKIVHGDLKASDILIMDDGTVKLTGYNTALTDADPDIAALGALIRQVLPESAGALEIADKAEKTGGEASEQAKLTVADIKEALGKLSDPNDRRGVPGFGSRNIGIRIVSWAVLAAAVATAIYGIFRYQRSGGDEVTVREAEAVSQAELAGMPEDSSAAAEASSVSSADTSGEAEASSASSGDTSEAAAVSSASSGDISETAVSSATSGDTSEAAVSSATSGDTSEAAAVSVSSGESDASSGSSKETSEASIGSSKETTETSSASVKETSDAEEASAVSSSESSETTETSSVSSAEPSEVKEASSVSSAGSSEVKEASSVSSAGSSEVKEASSVSSAESSEVKEASSVSSAESSEVKEASSDSTKETSDTEEIQAASSEESSEAAGASPVSTAESSEVKEVSSGSAEEISETQTGSRSEAETEEEKAAREAEEAFAETMYSAAADISREKDPDKVIEDLKTYMAEADEYLEQHGPGSTETAEAYRKALIAAALNSAVRQESIYRVSGGMQNASGALRIYEALGNYTENADMASKAFLDSIAGNAAKAMENGKLNKAEKLYILLSGLSYDGADNGLRNVVYQKALKFLEAGKLLEAADMFDDISGFKDADEQAAECRSHYTSTIKAAANAESGIAVSWVTLEEADGYYLTMDDTVTYDIGPDSISYTFTEANTNGKEYSFTVTPYFIDKEGNKDKGAESPAYTWTFLKKALMQKLASDRAGEVTITWEPNEYAGYYEIAYGLNPELTSSVVIMYMADQPTAQTITGLNPGTYYYFKVRSSVLGLENKVYSGAWSETIPIIVRDYAIDWDEY